jgi:hypothetical protein
MAQFKTMIAIALAAATCGAARAQTASVTPDPGRLALAQKIVAASGGSAQSEAQMRTVFAAVEKSLAANLPPEARDWEGQMFDEMGRDMIALTPRVLELTAQAYAETFNEAQLRDLLAFQASPTGQAMVEKAPALRAQIISETMPLLMNEMPAIMHKAAAQFCEQKHCTAEQRSAMETAMSKAFHPPGS